MNAVFELLAGQRIRIVALLKPHDQGGTATRRRRV